MRAGYFKVEQTNMHAAIIFPGNFVGDTPVVDLRDWLNRRGLSDALVYVPARAIVIPITELGAPV